MKKPRVQQRTERRISAALRLVLVAVLLVAQIALVLLLSTVLKQRAALAYTALELWHSSALCISGRSPGPPATRWDGYS